MTLAMAHALLPGSLLVGDGGTWLGRVHTDTRTLQPGDLFAALQGEHFDGHDYLPNARDAGAAAALAMHGLTAPDMSRSAAGAEGGAPDGLPGLQVADTLQALQTLAAGWRARFDVPLIAVTGSNGKTTVTQMVASMLREAHGPAALATAGNLNNHIGVPLTLLRLRPTHRAAVLELGMNHPGEIALLARLAAPTVALVNNAQREHQEFMDTVEAVAHENGAVIDALPADGTVVLPAADAHASRWRTQAGSRRVLTFGLADDEGRPDAGAVVPVRAPDAAPVSPQLPPIAAAPFAATTEATRSTAADITAAAVWLPAGFWQLTLHTPAGSVTTTLAQAGRHNVLNALAATGCALAAGVSLTAIAAGLAAFRPVPGRSQMLQAVLRGRQAVLIDDSYNANPDSVLAAIAVLGTLPGPRWLVLGDMGEVGSDGPRFHAEVGTAVRAQRIDHFWSAGTLCAHAGADRHFDTVGALLEALPGATPHAAAVLVKGSRFMRMEQVVQALVTGSGDVA